MKIIVLKTMMIQTTLMNEIESELKWEITLQGWQRLLSLLELKSCLFQTNYFFDDKKSSMGSARWALRLRVENNYYFLAAKGPAEKVENLSQRPEIEIELSEEEALAFLEKPSLEKPFRPCLFLKDLFGNLELEVFLSFKNERKVVSWEGEFLEIDHSTCGESQRYEIEWEADSDYLLKGKEKFETWLTTNGVEFSPAKEGKLSWALKES